MKALVLAAGISTRIAPVSKGLPKPLLEVAGLSVLKRNLAWLARANFSDIWINLHYRPDQIQKHLEDHPNIHYVYEPKILGTAGAVKNLQSEVDGTFLIIYGDNLFDFSLESFLAFHRNHPTVASLALLDQKRHLHTGIAGGRVLLNGTEIGGFIEGKSDLSLVNAGAYLIEPELLNYIPAKTFYDFGKDLFPDLLSRKIKLGGHLIDGSCLGIDTPESYHLAQKIMEA